MRALLQGTNGNFYGVASQGGSNGYGSVFKLTSTGALTELYGFTRIQTARPDQCRRGKSDRPIGGGHQRQFLRNRPGGRHQRLWRDLRDHRGRRVDPAVFLHQRSDGANPGALLQSSNGLIYGTTTNGGSNGYGTIFKMTSTGVLTPLYSFTNGVDGAHPGPALTQGTNGVLYGTASGGGTNGSGTIFQITTNGVFTPLYSFAPSGQAGLGLATNADGLNPGGLAQGPNGIFYGFAQFGRFERHGNIVPVQSVRRPDGALHVPGRPVGYERR